MKYIQEAIGTKLIKCWCNEPEDGAVEQAKDLARLPFIFKHVALMPDCHLGYGMPIGGVVACQGVVIPNAVGVDIGCGMAAVKTSLRAEDLSQDRIKGIMSLIRKKVPVGFHKHNEGQGINLMPSFKGIQDLFGDAFSKSICLQNHDNACKSLGTLGGGNHFIELQKDEEGFVWIMIHSGSRNLGKQICDHYNGIAIDLNKKYYNYTKDLAFLPLDSQEGQDYLLEMDYALRFAQANRDLMLERVKEALVEAPCFMCDGKGGGKGSKCGHCDGTGIFGNFGIVDFEPAINIHHKKELLELGPENWELYQVLKGLLRILFEV